MPQASLSRAEHAGRLILVLNGGSSTIKFALFDADAPWRELLRGSIDRLGHPAARLRARSAGGQPLADTPFTAGSRSDASRQLASWLKSELSTSTIAAVGHRIVHGGPTSPEHQLVSPRLLHVLEAACILDPTHLPGELELVRACGHAFPETPQVACFDTVFHRALPPAATLLPIPRRYTDAGVRKYGFHGLSYEYLMRALSREDRAAARGRIILAHLGSGASLAAVRDGHPIDTTMAFTPASGLVMSTRPGDLDPGVLVHMLRSGVAGTDELDRMINTQCGLLGLSGSSADMRDLLGRAATDTRAAEAVEVFCLSARKHIGALAAALGGLDTLVFAGGIGEHAPEVRARICRGLEFLGVHTAQANNQANAPIISPPGATVTVRIIPTNEESMIALHTARITGSTTQEAAT